MGAPRGEGLVTPPAVGVPGAPAKPRLAKAVFWKAPCADPQLCPEEGPGVGQTSGQVKCKDNKSLQVLAARATPLPRSPSRDTLQGTGEWRRQARGGAVTPHCSDACPPGFSISAQLTWAPATRNVTKHSHQER